MPYANRGLIPYSKELKLVIRQLKHDIDHGDDSTDLMKRKLALAYVLQVIAETHRNWADYYKWQKYEERRTQY